MKKTLWALAAAVSLLAALLLFKDHRQKSAAGPRPAFDPAQIRNIVGLHVAQGGDSATLIRSGFGHGWLTLPDSFPADTARIGRALSHLLNMENRERVSASADTARLAEFGLRAREARRVTWTLADGRTLTVLLGKTSGADYSSMFWKREGAPEVYRTPGTFSHEIPPHSREWKDPALFPAFSESDIRFLAVDWTSPSGARAKYRLEWLNDTAARLTEPWEMEIPPANAASLRRHASRLAIDDFPGPGEEASAQAALGTPRVTLRIGLESGEVRELKAGDDVNGFHYARHPGMREGVVKISEERLIPFHRSVEEILDSAAFWTRELDDGHGH